MPNRYPHCSSYPMAWLSKRCDPSSRAVFGKIQECHFQATAQIAHARPGGQVWICRTEPHFRDEVIDFGVGHLFGGCFALARGVGRFAVARRKVVVADVRAAADSQHTQKKRRKNNLHS